MSVSIKYVGKETTALTVNGSLFYLRQGLGVPQLFDERLKLQIIPNIDHWFQAKTQQRYSYRNICDMSAAFASGLQHSYTSGDLVGISEEIVDATVKAIFRTDSAREFSRSYWIELMDPGKLTKLIDYIRSSFDKFQEKYESEELYNILCRLWQFSNFYAPSEAAIFETIIRTKLIRIPQIPKYPDTSAIDAKIGKLVVENLLGKTLDMFKGISNELIDNVRTIQARGLQRPERIRSSP